MYSPSHRRRANMRTEVGACKDDEFYYNKAFFENYPMTVSLKAGGLLVTGKNADVGACKDDEFYSNKAFYENYSLAFWFKAGGLLITGKNAGPIFVPALFFTFSPILLFLLIATVVKTKSTNMETFCEAIHFILFIILEIIFLVAFYLKRSTIMQILTQMGKGFYDYKNTLDEDCIHKIAATLHRADRNKKITAKLFIGVVMFACITITVLRPAIKYLNGEHLLTDDGVEQLLPIPVWTPFRKGKWYSILLLFIVEDVIAYITPGIVFGVTLFVLYTCEDLGAQLIILGHTLKSVTRRADCLKMPRDEAIKLCFKHSIRHHQNLIKLTKALESILYIPGLGLFFGSTILMCMSGFIFVSVSLLFINDQLLKLKLIQLRFYLTIFAATCSTVIYGEKEVSFISKMVFFLFLLSELALIFIICWYGEYVQQTSTEIGNMVYSSEWTEDMKTMKSYILIIQLRSQRPLRINFGGLVVASHETFANICSSAFSYFNLMLAVN